MKANGRANLKKYYAQKKANRVNICQRCEMVFGADGEDSKRHGAMPWCIRCVNEVATGHMDNHSLREKTWEMSVPPVYQSVGYGEY